MRSVESAYPCMLLVSLVACGSFSMGCVGEATSDDLAENISSEESAYSRGGHHHDGDIGSDGPFDPTAVYVESLAYRGSGCPRGSVVATIAPDGQSMTLLFSEFIAEAGPQVKRREATQDCKVSLKLHVPKGHSAAVTSVVTRGFVQLEEGVAASQSTRYRFPGAARAEGTSSFTGEIAESYVREDVVETETRSRCGESVKADIDASLRVDTRQNRRGSGLITVDSVDGQIRQVFNMEFKPCRRHHGRD